MHVGTLDSHMFDIQSLSLSDNNYSCNLSLLLSLVVKILLSGHHMIKFISRPVASVGVPYTYNSIR